MILNYGLPNDIPTDDYIYRVLSLFSLLRLLGIHSELSGVIFSVVLDAGSWKLTHTSPNLEASSRTPATPPPMIITPSFYPLVRTPFHWPWNPAQYLTILYVDNNAFGGTKSSERASEICTTQKSSRS